MNEMESDLCPEAPALVQRLWAPLAAGDAEPVRALLAEAGRSGELAEALAWQSAEGETVLHRALLWGSLKIENVQGKRDIVDLILKAGFDLRRVNAAGESPLLAAGRMCHRFWRGIVSDWADTDDDDAELPFESSDPRRLALVYDLLWARADPDQGDVYGETLLLEAAMNGDVLLCKAALAAGARPDLANDQGETPLFFAAISLEAERLLQSFLVPPHQRPKLELPPRPPPLAPLPGPDTCAEEAPPAAEAAPPPPRPARPAAEPAPPSAPKAPAPEAPAAKAVAAAEPAAVAEPPRAWRRAGGAFGAWCSTAGSQESVADLSEVSTRDLQRSMVLIERELERRGAQERRA